MFSFLFQIVILDTTLSVVFGLTYYLELRNVLSLYCISHTLSTNVNVVVWKLYNINNLIWYKRSVKPCNSQ
jgi:hypothetical protein